MANRYWVGGTGTWDASSTTHWSATDGGASGASAPTLSDDVFFTASSGGGTVTVSGSIQCRDLVGTGATGTLNGGLQVFGSMNIGGLTLTTGAVTWTFKGTSTYTITSNGKAFANSVVIDAVTGAYTLADALSVGTLTITLTSGTFATANQSVTAGTFSSNNSNTRTLTLGSSQITVTGTGTAWNMTTNGGLSLPANTATITLSGAGSIFQRATSGAPNMNGMSLVFTGSGAQSLLGGAMTGFTNITRTGTATKTDSFVLGNDFSLTGTFTVNGNSATNRVLVQSGTVGTARTLTAASVSASNVDFMDITGAGAANWDLSAITGGSGDAGGNNGIAFTTSVAQTHTASAGGNWSDVTKWTSRVPLPQDDVVVDGNTTGTLTADMPRLGRSITLTGFTGTLATGSGWTNFGSFTLASGMAFSGTNALVLAGRGTHAFTSAGKSLPFSTTFQGPGSSWTLADAYVNTATTGLVINDGTFNMNNQSVSSATFTAASGRATTLNLGSSVISLTSTSTTTVWNTAALTTFINAGTSEIVITNAAAAAVRTLAWGASSTTSPQTLNKLTYTVASSPGVLQLQPATTNGGALNTLNIGAGKNWRLVAGRLLHLLNALPDGTSGNLITLDTNTVGSTATISKQYVGPQSNVYSFFGTAKAKDGYLLLDGASGSYMSTPDSAALSITGDIDIRCLVAMDDWTPVATQVFVNKQSGSTSTASYRISTNADGTLRLLVSDGVAVPTADSSAATGFVDGSKHWVRATWQQSDGRVQFFTADGSLSSPAGADWVQLGSNQTANVAAIADTASPLEIGSRLSGASNNLAGKVYKAEVRDGIDGTVVASPDFTAQIINQQSYLSLRDSSATGYGAWWASNSTNVSGNSGWRFNDGNYIGWGDPV